MSICNRIWRRTGEPCCSLFAFDITADITKANSLFRRVPEGIPAIAGVLKVAAEELAYDHTLLPYYESTSPRPLDGDELRALLVKPHPNSRYRINSWRSQPLQFCASCVAHDLEELGEPLWRRSHQLPGVRVCMTHREWLCSSCPACGWEASVRALADPPERCQCGHRFASSTRDGDWPLKHELELASLSAELLSYRAGRRATALSRTLRVLLQGAGIAHDDPSIDEALDKLYKRNKTWMLDHAGDVHRRVANTTFEGVFFPALRGLANRVRPPPIMVALCIKALLGPEVDVVKTLCDVEGAPLLRPAPDDWLGRWSALPLRGGIDERISLLCETAAAQRHAINVGTASALCKTLAAALDISRESINRYRRMSPVYEATLRALWPHVFDRSTSR